MLSIKRYRVPVHELMLHVDPLSGWLWECGPISKDEIKQAVAAGQLEPEPWDSAKQRLQGPSGREFHIQRIAYFVEYGLPSDEHSVQLDLQQQVNEKPVGIMNGNHRIAAAHVRGDKTIDVLLYFSDLVDVTRLFPGATPL